MSGLDTVLKPKMLLSVSVSVCVSVIVCVRHCHASSLNLNSRCLSIPLPADTTNHVGWMQAVHGQEIGVAQVSGRVVVVVGGAAVHGRDNGVDSGDGRREIRPNASGHWR